MQPGNNMTQNLQYELSSPFLMISIILFYQTVY